MPNSKNQGYLNYQKIYHDTDVSSYSTQSQLIDPSDFTDYQNIITCSGNGDAGYLSLYYSSGDTSTFRFLKFNYANEVLETISASLEKAMWQAFILVDLWVIFLEELILLEKGHILIKQI